MANDVIASGGAEPIAVSPDIITAIEAVNAAAELANTKSVAAAASATSAAASLFIMQSRFLGAQAGDPVLDLNNQGLLEGASYFNTTINRIKVFDGSLWIVLAGQVLGGPSVPLNEEGTDGDFWIRTDVPQLYGPKAGGVWPAPVDLGGAVPWSPPVDWAVSTAYIVGPPASCVVYSGETYVCIVAHTSTASFDASKWVKITSTSVIPAANISDSTVAGRAVLTAADDAAQRTALGLGTAALLNDTTVGGDLVEAVDAAAARTALGLGSLATASQVGPTQAPSGSWVLLNTLTAASSASLSDTTHFTSAYDEYEIVLENLVPSITNTILYMQLYIGGALKNTGYVTRTYSVLAGAFNSTAITTGFELAGSFSRLSNASGRGASGKLRIRSANSAWYKKLLGETVWTDSGAADACSTSVVAGEWTGGTGLLTGFITNMSSGVISTGKIHIFGRVK